MALIGGMRLDQMSDAKAARAIALELSSAPSQVLIRPFAHDGFEVELRPGIPHIVVRTSNELSRHELLNFGIAAANKALDLLSVEKNEHFTTLRPTDEHVGFIRENGEAILWYQGVSDLHASMKLSAEKTEPDENPIDPSAVHPLTWTPAFRFYRQAQINNDPFEAFRNLYLSFEALIDQRFPFKVDHRGKKLETEKEWLKRAIKETGERTDLSALFSPGIADPVTDLRDTIYNIRKQVFHAKTGQTLIPADRADHLAVAQAYAKLLGLWTAFAHSWLSLQRGGGVFYTSGFAMLVKPAMTTWRMAITADTTPLNKEEKTLSPKGLPAFIIPNHPVIVELEPGCIGVQTRVKTFKIPTGQRIGRILAITSDDFPATGSCIAGSLSLENVDLFEVTLAVRILNGGMPRTEFP